jgi:hypothetical protein
MTVARHRQRNSSGEVVDDVGEVVEVTTVSGSLAGMTEVGRSSCACGEARRRQGFWPNHGDTVQFNELGSFMVGQGGCRRKELKNGSLSSPVYERWWVAEVQ